MALLGSNYDLVRKYNADLVGAYYTDMYTGESMTPAQVSARFSDTHHWPAGWRIQDVNKEIWSDDCGDDCIVQGTSVFFVLNTATMKIDSYNPIGFEGVIEAIQIIDEENP